MKPWWAASSCLTSICPTSASAVAPLRSLFHLWNLSASSQNAILSACQACAFSHWCGFSPESFVHDLSSFIPGAQGSHCGLSPAALTYIQQHFSQVRPSRFQSCFQLVMPTVPVFTHQSSLCKYNCSLHFSKELQFLRASFYLV